MVTTNEIRQKKAKDKSPHVRISGHTITTLPGVIGEKLLKAYETKNRIRTLQERLDQLNKELAAEVEEAMEMHQTASCRIRYQGIECQVRQRDTVIIADHQKLKKILGDDFEHLVRIRISYEPERKLRELAGSDKKILNCLDIKEAKPTLTYNPIT